MCGWREAERAEKECVEEERCSKGEVEGDEEEGVAGGEGGGERRRRFRGGTVRSCALARAYGEGRDFFSIRGEGNSSVHQNARPAETLICSISGRTSRNANKSSESSSPSRRTSSTSAMVRDDEARYDSAELG